MEPMPSRWSAKILIGWPTISWALASNRADLIAERLGISRTAMVRARAGIAYTLAEAMANGHCGLAEDKLLVQAEKLLEIPSATLAEALQAELATGEVVADLIDGRRCIFLAYLWRAERLIAHRLQTLIHERPPWPVIDAERAIGWVEKKFGVTLAASQRAAVTLALANKLLVVTGGPGVGKTTLVNSILKILCAKSVTVALCAPTGRAAKRLAESTGLEAKTILRLFRPKQRLRPRPLGGAAARPPSLGVQCAVIAGPPEPVRRAGSGRGRPRCR